MSEGYCGECGQPCDVDIVDEGIGHYEFWGQVGNHSNLCAESSCCGSNVYEDEACTIEFNSETEAQSRAEYEADAKHEAWKEAQWDMV